MAMSVRERVREIGVLKTLGFTPGAILGIILGEAVVIALIGAALGLVLAAGICDVIRAGPITFADLKALHVPAGGGRLGLLLAALIGLCSSVVPAWSASRRPIVECAAVHRLGATAMAIPLTYNLRNLAVRKTTTLMTALGIALTVAVLLAVMALVEGLRRRLRPPGTRCTCW